MSYAALTGPEARLGDAHSPRQPYPPTHGRVWTVAAPLHLGGAAVTDTGFDRNARLEGEIRAVLAEVLHSDIKDPRLEGVTVSAVKLSADRSHARVYFSVIGDDERARHAADAFAAASSFMRRQLGRRMRLRTVPSLEVARDTSYEYGDRMERLFHRLHTEGLLDDVDSGEDQ